MADQESRGQVRQAGSVALNLHEGSRSEYLAQFVFSGFGTAVPVPHQEDSGLDIYCTLLERMGQRAWPRAYYSVQVKSSLSPWVFEGKESVRWLIEHPLPIFLCVVLKSDLRLLVYHTTPRFVAWASPTLPERLELNPGTETTGTAVSWDGGHAFSLGAPVLDFTVEQVLDPDYRVKVSEILKQWIDRDNENLTRIRNGINWVWAPGHYTTNSTDFRGWVYRGTTHFSEKSFPIAAAWLKEFLGLFSSHFYRSDKLQSAAIYAMTLWHLVNECGESVRDLHDPALHFDLNLASGLNRSVYDTCDSLLQVLKDKLTEYGIKIGPRPEKSSSETTNNQKADGSTDDRN